MYKQTIIIAEVLSKYCGFAKNDSLKIKIKRDQNNTVFIFEAKSNLFLSSYKFS